MTQQKSFIQLIIYLVLLLVLIYPLYLLGRPAKTDVVAGVATQDQGGVLAQIRAEEGLMESQLGSIDPASSTVKLATFGLRGVAIAMLWHRTQEYQKRKDWGNVIAMSNQLVLLEPHFTTIWDYLGWNLAYNASAEFDDYRERYRWVIRGFDFLARGVECNTQAPKLCQKTGWTMSQKIGIADENQQYRRLLRDDEDFGTRYDCKLPSERDNWMLGRRWYKMGEDLVLNGADIGNESDFLFFSHSRLNLFNYAMWIRKDGIFGEVPIRAWEYAGEQWKEFAKMDLSTAIPEDGSMKMKPGVKAKRAMLQTTDLLKAKEKELLKELSNLVPDLRESLCIKRWKQIGETTGQQGSLLQQLTTESFLNPKDDESRGEEYRIIRAWLEKNEPDWQKKLQADLDTLYTKEQLDLKKIPTLLLEEDQQAIVAKADGEVAQVRGRSISMLQMGSKVFAQEIQDTDAPVEKKRRARSIVQEIDGFPDQMHMSNLYRDILNYDFRIREVSVERTQEVDDARRLRHIGRVAYYDGRIKDSIKLWLESMAKWDELFQKPGFKYVESDVQFMRDIIDIVEKFVIILDHDNSIFSTVCPDKVPLAGMIRNKLNQENNPEEVLNAIDYAKKEFESGDYAKAEKHFNIIVQRFGSIYQSIEYMKLAPLYDIRDKTIESLACYIKSLQKQGKPLPAELPLRSFAELMIKHDPLIDQAVDAIQPAVALMQGKKFAEAQTELDKSVELWKKVLDKYPLIPLDPTLQSYADAAFLAQLYAENVKAREQSLPEDFPLKSFLKQ